MRPHRIIVNETDPATALTVECSAGCLDSGTEIATTVRIDVAFPGLGGGPGLWLLLSVRVSAHVATQVGASMRPGPAVTSSADSAGRSCYERQTSREHQDRPVRTCAAPARRLPARGDETGQILVLTLGLPLVVLLL